MGVTPDAVELDPLAPELVPNDTELVRVTVVPPGPVDELSVGPVGRMDTLPEGWALGEGDTDGVGVSEGLGEGDSLTEGLTDEL